MNEEKKINWLLDQDGVLTDFISGAIQVLNKTYGGNLTIEEYAHTGKWEIYDVYGITLEQFWAPIDAEPNFWINLKPIPWYKELYELLKQTGDVTIVTTPSNDPDCARQKLIWLNKHLNIKSTEVFLGSRKYLMAGNGILVDDYFKNTDKFKAYGGQAILVPSIWNTPGLTWNQVLETILEQTHTKLK